MSGPGARFSASVAMTNELNGMVASVSSDIRARRGGMSTHEEQQGSRFRRFRLLAVAAVVFALWAAAPPAAQRPSPFDLEEATIADLQQRMAKGQDTARSLAEKYLARIEATDRQGPALR